MKKITSIALVALLAAGSVFAQPIFQKKGNPDKGEAPKKMECPAPQFPGRHSMKKMHSQNDSVIIGMVKSVKPKAHTLRVIDTDGKDVEVKVSPFTKIVVCNQKQKPEEITLDKLGSGAWVMISTYKTDTKSFSASRIMVKDNPDVMDLSNTK